MISVPSNPTLLVAAPTLPPPQISAPNDNDDESYSKDATALAMAIATSNDPASYPDPDPDEGEVNVPPQPPLVAPQTLPPPQIPSPPAVLPPPQPSPPPPPTSLTPCQAHIYALIVLNFPLPSTPLLPPLPSNYNSNRLPYSNLVTRLTSSRNLHFLTCPELKKILKFLKQWYPLKVSGKKIDLINQIFQHPYPILEDTILYCYTNNTVLVEKFNELSEDVRELLKVALPLTVWGVDLINEEIRRVGASIPRRLSLAENELGVRWL